MIFNLAVHVHDTGSNGVTNIIGIMVDLFVIISFFKYQNVHIYKDHIYHVS